jgi:hypothetical protein
VELRDYTRGESPAYGNFDQILSECRASLDRMFRKFP